MLKEKNIFEKLQWFLFMKYNIIVFVVIYKQIFLSINTERITSKNQEIKKLSNYSVVISIKKKWYFNIIDGITNKI
jgi:hypothetical protein